MSGTPIIVPVHLDAICVGLDDAKNHLSCFAPPLYDFTELDVKGAGDVTEKIDRAGATPFTSDRLTVQRFGNAAAKPAGVYLHWAMPAALTHGVVKYRITREALEELRHEGLPASILNGLDPSKKDNQILTDYRPLSYFKEHLGPRIKRALSLGRDSKGEVDWYISWVCRVASHMTFPALPDRWLVVRVWIDGPGQPKRAWLIESDFVTSLRPDSNVPSATIPWPFTSEDGAMPGDGTQLGDKVGPFYRYLGRVRKLDETWPEGTPERVSRLTAIGYGKSAFAAYLPNCQNVFGHYDCLDDVKLDGTQAARLLYTVVGWFSRPEDDPFDPRRYDSKADSDRTMKPRAVYGLMAQRKWTLPDDEPEIVPEKKVALQGIARSFYSGVLKGVQWNPNHTYAGFHKWDPAHLHIALGHSEAEALAAYLAQDNDAVAMAAYLAQDKTSARPMTPEEKWEALQLGILKSIQDAPEPEVLLEQALHTSGFHAEDGGTNWRIAKRSWGDAAGSIAKQVGEKVSPPARPAPAQLPPEAGLILTKLNRFQRLFDLLQFFNEAQRRELFFHWYYHLNWRYGIPVEDDAQGNPDQTDKLIQKMEQLTSAEVLPGDIVTALKPVQGSVLEKALGELARIELANRPIVDQPIQNLPALEKALGELSGLIIHQAVDLMKLLKPLERDYRLWVERAPRFFQPNEPHLLIVDDESPVSSRYSTTAEGPLVCQRLDRLATRASQPADAVQLSTADDKKGGQLNDEQVEVANRVLTEALAALAENPASSLIPVTFWGVATPGGSDGVDRSNPWHPIIMEWQVKFHGFPRPTSYDKTFISGMTTLDMDGIDLCYKEDGGADATEYSSYAGTIVLSRRAFYTLQEQAKRYRSQCDDSQKLQALEHWLEGLQKSVLSQALYGFNDGLTTRLKEVQLAVYDPYATEQQEKEDMVRFRYAIGRYNDHTPNRLVAYNPIRAGSFEVVKIRLVDVFGQCRIIEKPKLILPQHLQLAKYPNYGSLPPRLVQPSRLLFRWLSAADEQPVEMNSHPDTSPICGWVVSNCLDDSLMIYAQNGTFLGFIRESADPKSDHPQWESPPGVLASGPSGNTPQDIPNAELREFVTGFLADSSDNFRNFLDMIERVLLIIESQNDPHQNALAVLMGRPLALVQAMLGLELKGPPTCRLDDDSYSQFLESGKLADDNFPNVQFQVRLGYLSSGSDGLVGYFKADGNGKVNYNLSAFHSEYTPEDQEHDILLASYDRVIVSMLVDPRASVHATSGILPVKTIDIPPDQYAASLRRMAFTFGVHPVLSPGRLRLPLPAESDQSWVWLSKSKEGWRDPITDIGKIAEWASYGQGDTLRIHEGWLQVNPLATEEQRKVDNQEETS